jgi:tumor protein p53-inducible protein 3
MDPVLRTFFEENLECLGMDSRWIIYGSMGGIKIKEANFTKLLSRRGRILTSTLRNRTDEYKTDLIRDMERDLMKGFLNGNLKPIIDKSFPLSQAVYALNYMQDNLNIGKIVLVNDF